MTTKPRNNLTAIFDIRTKSNCSFNLHYNAHRVSC